MKKFNNKSGFTLIEIIVVLIIVGILAAIALPNLFSNVSKSRANEALANIGSWRANVEACIAGHQGAEGTCTATFLGGAPTSPNFTYTLAATTPGNSGYQITATGMSALSGSDSITITRGPATNPSVSTSITCAGTGVLAGTC